MRLTLLAVGRLRSGALQSLLEEYRKRLGAGPLGPLAIREVEAGRQKDSPARKAKEAQLLLKALPKDARLIALDEQGRNFDSRAFAMRLGDWKAEGVGEVAFVIGGAQGLDDSLLHKADLILSLGGMTWPHMLVRVLLAEQIYRANAILQGHPYHRD